MHYLDNASTTPVHPQVAGLVCETLQEQWANPSSLYRPGFEAERVVTAARQTLAGALGCTAAEVVFTGSGSEGNNIAILGGALARRGWADHIVATGYEHPSAHKPLLFLQKQLGFRLTLVNPGADGRVDADALVAAVDGKTALVCAMHVNNETGAVLDAAGLAARVKEKNSRTAFHADGVQAFTKQPLRLSATAIDSYSLSGHKLHAPKGVGALYLRKGYHFLPPFTGGGQEEGRRPGTENTAYIAGMGRAVEIALAAKAEHTRRVAELDAALREGLAGLPDVEINTPAGAQPGILNLSLPGIRSETMLHFLEERDIYLSAGSACSQGEPSHTLTAMGLKPRRVVSALRISFDGYNTREDIAALLDGLCDGLASLARGRVGRRR